MEFWEYTTWIQQVLGVLNAFLSISRCLENEEYVSEYIESGSAVYVIMVMKLLLVVKMNWLGI